uniref:Uncharacterized protein n=1 Tax=viral metagenome TaxID=1070528 RepID=A0A6C0LFE1_9ZZZZ
MYYLIILCILLIIGYYSSKYLFFVLIGMFLSLYLSFKYIMPIYCNMKKIIV